MDHRGGEKWSWYLGSLGSSCWIVVGAGMMVAQGELAKGLIGLMLFAVAVTAMFASAPWRNPNTRYWKLILITLATPLGAIVWGIWCVGIDESRAVFLAIPLIVLLPILLVGKMRWSDQTPSEKTPQDTA